MTNEVDELTPDPPLSEVEPAPPRPDDGHQITDARAFAFLFLLFLLVLALMYQITQGRG
jgi:hypothetical protein